MVPSTRSGKRRSRLKLKGTSKAGLSPGALVHVGERRMEEVALEVIDYTPERVDRRRPETVGECRIYRESESVSWLDLNGLHDVEAVAGCGALFGLHPLVLEDVLNTGQRPKVEDFGEYLFVALKMLHWDDDAGEVRTEQLSMVLGAHHVLTFQEHPGDVFDPVRERIVLGKGRIRTMGPDYLLFSLLDAVVDNYLVVLERLGEELERQEERLEADPTPESLAEIHRVKRELIFVRRAIWPLREGVSLLARADSALISEASTPFFRDLYDHTIQVIDTVETFRDVASGLQDLYLSLVSNRMNEVMKVLTIIATIFIPLTFIAGIYGMNFDVMPELKWELGYPAVWVLMIALFLGMLRYFRHKRWL